MLPLLSVSYFYIYSGGERMNKRGTVLIVLVCFLFSLSGCTPRATRYQAEFLTLFDTIPQIVAYRQTKAEFEKLSQDIHDELLSYHQLYDIYKDYDGIVNMKTINDSAGKAPVKVDQKIIDLLLFSKEMYGKTNGKVNIAMGSVLKIWHDYREEGIDDPENAKVPPKELLKKAAEHTDITKVIINEADSTVFLSDPEMRLDVGAIAKGYATEMVSRKFSSVIISVGGNVKAMGFKDEKKTPWNTGIENPDRESEKRELYIVTIHDAALVTSGDYQRYYTVDGKQYHHIIDPDTLMPQNTYRAVTIVAADSGVADALSTALFNMSVEEGTKLIHQLGDIQVLWVFQDQTVRYSDGFEALIKKDA